MYYGVTIMSIDVGIKKGYLKIVGSKVQYLAAKKEYNFTDPEEKVRARFYVDLIENYQYLPSRIDVEVYSPRREPKLPADIVVFEDDAREHRFIVVETKATSAKNQIDEAKREGLGNATLLDAKFLVIYCNEQKIVFNVEKKPPLDKLDNYVVADIPVKYGKIPKYKFKRGDPKWDLRRTNLSELSNKFQLCHDEIWEGGKRDPAVAFDEMSKLMFAKIYDERFTPTGEHYQFQVGTYENPLEVAQKVSELYIKAQEKFHILASFVAQAKRYAPLINMQMPIIPKITVNRESMCPKALA